MRSKTVIVLTLILAFVLALSCRKDIALEAPELLLSPEEGEELPGGQQSTFDQSVNAFSQPAPGLTGTNALFFFTGNSLFNQNWVTAPASTTARDGLGPAFNARSCSGCHFKDGRGNPPNGYDQTSTGFLVRLSIPGIGGDGGPNPDPSYGTQLSDQSVLGIDREGQVLIQYNELTGQFPDGETYSLRQPTYSFAELNYGPVSGDLLVSPRVGQQMIGLGLLEAIADATIVAQSDPNDSDNDGISGKPNYVWNVEAGQMTVGRFGWKANQPNVKQQVAGAFAGDLGITSNLFPNENCPGPQIDCANAPNGGAPELDDENLDKVVLYSSNLAVPSRPNYADQAVLEGKELFKAMNCSGCHTPSYTTGNHTVFPHLGGQKIFPYTDLLLHDMGPALADNRPDFDASGTEWRTPPLWGIGLFQTVNGHTLYLHDGRARNLTEAILWHGGEADAAKNAFVQLEASEREKVILFLESL